MSATGYGDNEATHLRAEAARRLILGQNFELRRLLARGIVQALRVEDSACVHGPLRETLPLVRELFAQHLADEEAWLLATLEANLLPGPQHSAPIREKHAGHRVELEALCDWPERGGDLELADRFDAFARELLTDLAREERVFPVPQVLRAGGTVTPRRPVAGTPLSSG